MSGTLEKTPLPESAALTDIEARRRAALERRLATERKYLSKPGCEDDAADLKMMIAIPGLTWTLKLLGLWNTGRANATRVTLHEREWRVPGLPAGLEGFTLLHLSDLHYPRRDDGFAEAVEAMVDGVEADLCVMTGDYRYGHLGPMDHVPMRMATLLQRIHARHGVYGVLGNHDTAAMAGPLRDAGLNLLVNEGAEIIVNGVRLWLAGSDDPHTMKADDFGAAMHGADGEHFVIALVHTPELIEEAEAAGARLYFCGHTHGGQVRVPYWGPIETNCRVAPRFIHGEWRQGNMLGITTAGLGTTDVPVRINCPAEAHRITLRAG